MIVTEATKRYADVYIEISHERLDRPFQYEIPREFQEQLEIGMCVMVPFGVHNKLIKGYCVDITGEAHFEPERIKAIAQVLPNEVQIENRYVQLAYFLKKQYGSTMIQALKTVLPAKQKVKQLENKKIVLKCTREMLQTELGSCMRKKQAAKVRLLGALLQQPVIPYSYVTSKLNISSASLEKLQAQGIIELMVENQYRNPVKLNKAGEEKKQLSQEQAAIVDTYVREFHVGHRDTYYIHGITGSGKTEVYIRAIEATIEAGYECIVLIPEIALTYQTLMRFYERFGDLVSVMNSNLSQGEKYDQCMRAKKGEIKVIIGPRSALFVPFQKLGLIIVDEEHESSYKSETMPKYHAREVAMELSRLTGCSLMMGSATPSLESYFRAKAGDYRLFSLTKRLTGGELPTVYVEDLRKELKEGNKTIFSRRLQALLEDRLSKGEQAILFLNRRGYAGFYSCRSCGQVMKCPHCDVSLTEHLGKTLQCHYCGYTREKPALCPSCGSRYILGFRAGTQQIEEKIKEMYPQARTLRMDADTTRKKDSYENILSQFSQHKADILIGTQMIVKGHDFPNVTLVGVLAADLSLSVSDYRAGERTFQLLTQAVGRAGRGDHPGEAVIQTYQPEHYAVVHAANQDYESFYREELLYRQMGGYPPAGNLLAVWIYGKDENNGMILAKDLANVVKSFLYAGKGALVLGPGKASIGKINDIYRHVFFIKHKEYEALVAIKDMLESYMNQKNIGSETVQFDFNPINGM